MSQPAHTLVIGYGSPIRGDDAVGPLAAEALAAGALPAGVQAIARHVLTAELVPELAAAARVVFLDATAHGPAGEVRVQPLAAQPALASPMAHTHDPRELLAWCETLYGRAPEAWLVTCAGERFDYAHCELSPRARAALAGMLDAVRKLLARPLPAAASADQAVISG